MLLLQLGQFDLAKVLDIKGRNKAVAANLIPICTLLGCVVYWIKAENGLATVLLGIGLIVVSFIIGVRLQTLAVIESVFRCKDGKNRKVYLKNKVYFDKKFKKLVRSDRPCRKRHITKQQGGDNDSGRK